MTRSTEYLEGGDAVLAALERVADTGRTGTAWLMGGNVGALYFRDGLVVGAELEGMPWCRTMSVTSGRLSPVAWDDFARAWEPAAPQPRPGAPPGSDLDFLEWAKITLEATVEAASELLPLSPENTVADLVLQPSDIPGWTGASRSMTFSALRCEIARRQFVLDRLRPIVTPDSVVVRASPDWSAPVQVSAPQWRILTASGDGESARSIGRRIGSGTFATTLQVCTMLRLGMLVTRDSAGLPRRSPAVFPRTLFLDAAGAAGR